MCCPYGVSVFSKWGPQTSSIVIIWELIRYALTQESHSCEDLGSMRESGIFHPALSVP